MKYLLDTNICIYTIRHKPPHVLERFQEHQVGEIGLSSITAGELWYGVEKSQHPAKNQEALLKFLFPLEILPFDHLCAESYGKIRAHLESGGTPIGALDTLIAAQALSRGLTLVTHNTREFERVPGLKIEDWV